MASVAATWRALTRPSPAVVDAEERRRATLLLSLVLPLLPIVLLTAAFAPFLTRGPINPFTFGPSMMGLATGLAVSLVYLLGRTRHHEAAAVLFVAVSTVAAWANFLASRGEVNGGFVLAFLGAGLLLSGLLLTVPVTIALVAIDVAGLVALAILLPDVDAAYVAIPAVFVGIIGFLVVISSAVRVREGVERKVAQDAMRASENRYRSLVESAPDAIIVHSGGAVLYANPAAHRLFAAPMPNGLVGSLVMDLTDPAYREIVKERVKAIEQQGETTAPLEIRVRRFDGRPVEVEAMGAPAEYDGKPADQTILRDVTVRKEAEATSRLARERLNEIERLQEINSVKTGLLNMASHELNTPIAALRLQLHMLKLGHQSLDPRQQKAVSLLDRNVERLALLVKDVLDVARMQSGQLQLRKAPTDLAVLAQDVLDFYAEAYRNANVELRLEGAPLAVEADAQRLTQVLNNLLSNALKFTPPGGEVTIKLERRDADAVLSVHDTGPGLTLDQISRLFEPFSQVHDTSKGTHGGTGLGLHICKGIVEQHGGRIWAESAGPGQGSRFCFAVPMAAPAVAPRA